MEDTIENISGNSRRDGRAMGEGMKRVNGTWYVNACLILVSNGRDVKGSNWQIAGTFERACLMMGGHQYQWGIR